MAQVKQATNGSEAILSLTPAELFEDAPHLGSTEGGCADRDLTCLNMTRPAPAILDLLAAGASNLDARRQTAGGGRGNAPDFAGYDPRCTMSHPRSSSRCSPCRIGAWLGDTAARTSRSRTAPCRRQLAASRLAGRTRCWIHLCDTPEIEPRAGPAQHRMVGRPPP
jgi:hypothetical protein